MAEGHTFDVKIQSDSPFYVGQDKSNRFHLTLTYLGEADQLRFNNCTFRLRVGVGDGVDDLVLSENSAKKVETEISENFNFTPSLESKQRFVWEIISYEETPFTKANPLTLTFSNIESNTKAGTANPTFEVEIGDKKEQYPLDLVKKSADEASLIYFYSTTAERVASLATTNSIFPAAEQILSGEKVTFHWSVKDLKELTLKKGGITPIQISQNAEGEKEVADITENTEFILSGSGTRGAVITEKVSIWVLKSGWHDSTMTLDNARLEPTCLFSADADNPIVYAVFRRNHTQDEGLLFKTENPFWGWSQMPGKVPAGFVTSPGVYHQNKLWLVGGSQIDPQITSNEIWVTEIAQAPTPSSGKWAKLQGRTPWVPRMGHAVLVYENDIWVLGGCDENGNALNDCWRFKVLTKEWGLVKPDPPWSKRCMFSAVPFKNNNNWEIWLCGGVKEPFSDDFLRDLYIYKSAGTWEGPVRLPAAAHPGAVGLQVFREKQADRLRLIGQSTQPPVETFIYKLDAPTKPDAWSKVPSDQLQAWAEETTVVFQLANFKNKLLIANALGYDHANDRLKVFIP
jgi:hypothetical protein